MIIKINKCINNKIIDYIYVFYLIKHIESEIIE